MIYKLKDSIDLFLTGDIITAFFINTRKQLRFKVNDLTIKILETVDGIKSVDEIAKGLDINKEDVAQFCQKLESLKIMTCISNDINLLSIETKKRYTRQLNYFSEFFNTVEETEEAHVKLEQTRFLIFGVGAVGSAIAQQLVMAGAKHLTLFDYDNVGPSDISRHMLFSELTLGSSKVEAVASDLRAIDSDVDITTINEVLSPNTRIDHYIEQSDFVINTLDEPYIGYTSAKISRICTPLYIPHYIAGGFDAHLASTGELIIPGVTPCVECYATHFKEVLKDWKPEKHPVEKRYEEIGGLASMTLFSASFATIEIIKHVMSLFNREEDYKTRGELLFKDLSLTYIHPEKNPNCIVCGKLGVQNES